MTVPMPSAVPDRKAGLLADLPIPVRIGALVGASLLTLLMTMGLFLLAEGRTGRAADRMAAFSQLADEVTAVDRLTLEMQGQIQIFLRDRTAGAADEVRRAAAEMQTRLDRIRDAPAATSAGTSLNVLDTRLDEVMVRFGRVFDATRIVGLTEHDGLTAVMMSAAAQAQDELKKWPPSLAAELLIAMSQMREAERAFLAGREERYLGLHRKAYNEMSFFIPGSQLDDSTKAELDQLVRAYRTAMIELAEAMQGQQAEAEALTTAFAAMKPEVDGLFAMTRDGVDQARMAQLDIREGARVLTLAVGALLAVLFCCLALLLARSITRPIAQIEQAMGGLARGERLELIPGTNRGDEIGDMARAIDVFRRTAEEMERLKAEEQERERRHKQEFENRLARLATVLEEEVAATVEAVLAEAADIATLAGEMNDAADRTGEQSQGVAGAAQDATGNVQTVAAATEELAASGREVGRQVAMVADVVHDAVRRGARTRDIAEQLADAARNIGRATELIATISGQTNLLALNATIEAARAGEAGRGFAIVASEVKTLASQTGKATEEIAAQIAAVQEATERVIGDIAGLQTVIGRIDGIAKAITAAVAEQGSATESISESASGAAGRTGEVFDRIRAVAADAETTGRIARRLDTKAAQVTDQVGALRQRLAEILHRGQAA